MKPYSAAKKVVRRMDLWMILGLAILLSVSTSFAGQSTHPPSAPPGSQQSLAQSDGSIDVSAMLQAATKRKVKLSKQEIAVLLGPHQQQQFNEFSGATRRTSIFGPSYPQGQKVLDQTVAHCNSNSWKEKMAHDHLLLTGGDDIFLDAGEQCGFLGMYLVNAMGVNNAEAELALQRACALPEVRTDNFTGGGIGNLCSMLGDLYRARGELDLALAVYEHAPNCDIGATRLEGVPNPDLQLLEACPQGAVEVFKAKNDVADERAVLGGLCAEYSDKFSNDCDRFQQLGGSVNINAMNAQIAAYHSEIRAQDDQAQALWQQAQQQQDARTNAFLGALSSLPGANDPNAIVDTANQQAANVVAVGAANDAARAQAAAAQQRQQGAVQQVQANSQQAAQKAANGTVTPQQATQQNQQQGQAATNQATSSSVSAANATPSNTGSPAATNGTFVGACTDMTHFVTAKGQLNSDGIVVGYLTNNSNQPVYVTYTFGRGGQPAKNETGSITLNPGQTIGGEGSGIWATSTGPAAVDSNPPHLYWYAVLQSDANQLKNCGSPW